MHLRQFESFRTSPIVPELPAPQLIIINASDRDSDRGSDSRAHRHRVVSTVRLVIAGHHAAGAAHQ
eukprot:205047-Hanusia_phi.AAC.4